MHLTPQNTTKIAEKRAMATADFSLKQFYRCIAPLSMEQRVSSPQMAMPLPGLKKERLHYSKKHPNNKKIT